MVTGLYRTRTEAAQNLHPKKQVLREVKGLPGDLTDVGSFPLLEKAEGREALQGTGPGWSPLTHSGWLLAGPGYCGHRS